MADPSSLRSLAAEIEAAPGDMPEAEKRELSDKALLACGWSSDPNYQRPYINPQGRDVGPSDNIPRPLASRDDAHRLLPEGVRPSHILWLGDRVEFQARDYRGKYHRYLSSTARFEEAAITAAALYARAAEMEG